MPRSQHIVTSRDSPGTESVELFSFFPVSEQSSDKDGEKTAEEKADGEVMYDFISSYFPLCFFFLIQLFPSSK